MRRLASILCVTTLAACSSADLGPSDAGSPDGAPGDDASGQGDGTGSDGTVPDSQAGDATDAGSASDAADGGDAGDATVDASADAAGDAGADAMLDATPDAALDAADATPDAAPDSAPGDAMSDATADADSSAPPDASASEGGAPDGGILGALGCPTRAPSTDGSGVTTLLDLGLQSYVWYSTRLGDLIASEDHAGNWVLWNAAQNAVLASGTGAQTNSGLPQHFPPLQLGGALLMVLTSPAWEVRSASDGHLIATLPLRTLQVQGYNEAGLATDGSYFWATGP